MEQSLIDDLLHRCTVKLTVGGGHGTGFFVAPGLILTCAHVVKEAGAHPIQVRGHHQYNFSEATIERSLPDVDIVLLRFSPPPNTNVPCVLLDTVVESRDPLYLFGYPDQDFPNGCPATFNCEGLTGDEPPLIKFQLGQVRPGMSGAPLLNQRTGKVCGVVKFTRDRSTDLGGGAVPVSVVLSRFGELVELQRRFHQVDKRWENSMRQEQQRLVKPLVSAVSAAPKTFLIQFFSALTRTDEFFRSISHDMDAELIQACKFALFTSIVNLVLSLPVHFLRGTRIQSLFHFFQYFLIDTVLTYAFWFLYGTIFHLFAKLLGGSGSCLRSIITFLYLTAFISLSIFMSIPRRIIIADLGRKPPDLSSFEWLVKIAHILVKTVSKSPEKIILPLIAEMTVFIYFAICTIVALRIAHGIGRRRSLFIALLGFASWGVIVLLIQQPVFALFHGIFATAHQ